jgi:hypothetical protein
VYQIAIVAKMLNCVSLCFYMLNIRPEAEPSEQHQIMDRLR